MMAVLGVAVSLGGFGAGAEEPPRDITTMPQVTGGFGGLSERLKGPYDVVLRPDEGDPENWAGAPSVMRDGDGVFWLACRMRSPKAPRGQRGFELRILRSADGIHFEPALHIMKEEVPIQGFERPALLRDPKTGRAKLYGCGAWKGGPWTIYKFDDADSPDKFVAGTAHAVIEPRAKAFERDTPPVEYKDPFILYAEGAFHCYVIGYVRNNERTFHFTSADGESWEPVGHPYQPILPLSGWHDFFVRPSCVVPTGAGYLFVYEGSSTTWHDPVYNVTTGLGYTFDLHHIVDLTPDSPLMVSSTPGPDFAMFRYSHWMRVGNEMWVYAEVACTDATSEIRLYRLPM